MSRLTRVEINKAINNKIKAAFPGIEIQSRDVEEGFKRPSFFVSLETSQTEAYLSNRLREMTCRILFFPTDKHLYKEEAYGVMDKLETLFVLNFAAGSRVITIGSATADIVDKVVHYDFDFAFYEDTQESETGELMQELHFDG
ncbi:hypothetical protein PV433_31020 [Paenibacillus sp. GYB004]|uniref:phage tail terminator family protein n=1 Tax=Paenibacillus sp. GYB004 TaxID=2994393 RepID=UPI002F9684EE